MALGFAIGHGKRPPEREPNSLFYDFQSASYSVTNLDTQETEGGLSLEEAVEEFCGGCLLLPYALERGEGGTLECHVHFWNELLAEVMFYPREFRLTEEHLPYYTERQLWVIETFREALIAAEAAVPWRARAEEIARAAHAGQVDLAGEPYVEHLAYVAARVEGDAAKAVAWLHDIVEDTDVTMKDLEHAGFPAEVGCAVGAITRRPDEDYHDYIKRLSGNELARQVKIQDLLHNMDLTRLEEPTERDFYRLHDKYLPALAALLAT